ncbi:LysR substrate-binding domain-containing protein [Pseudofrancisella aestuarii]|uniref:LysR substrate-binding domain-containing protein n=1 Tax=Pseudofrancisella aestuarii TaxID=2670347 RepID=A0ABV9T8U6_9GAMM|nr:LysR substrate-binding domain-containing protein [Pseudofrancisella aestuarii]
MNTRTLEYILAVYETQSFITASEKCFVSQPALSMQIKKFEDSLDIQIFERNSKNIIATKIGEEVIKQAYKILEDVKNLKDLVSLHLDNGRINVSIGVIPTLGPYLMPNILPPIKAKIPNISISIVEEKTDTLIDMLEHGKLDFAILADNIENRNFVTNKLFRDNFCLAISTENQLSKGKDLSVKDIQEQNLMLLDEGHCMGDQALEFCSTNKLSYNNNFRASSLETLRQMVSVDEGITFIPKIAQTKTSKVKYIKIKNSDFHRNIYLVMRKSSTYSTLFKELSKIISDNYK